MRRVLILCRHGNTFNAGEPVFIVGSQQDLSLTEFGREQALRVSVALKDNKLIPDRIVSAPLRRTLEFAEIIGRSLDYSGVIQCDFRLTELDYGAWGGLSDVEIGKKWGVEVLSMWQRDGIRPKDVAFFPSEAVLKGETLATLNDFRAFDGVTLAVTSNGRLREFSRVLTGAAKKVCTGHLCILEADSDGNWRVLGWDLAPSGCWGGFGIKGSQDQSKF